MVFKILSGLLKSSISPEKKNLAICLIYGIIMFLRCHELSRIQRINSVLLTQGQASVNVSDTNIYQNLFHYQKTPSPCPFLYEWLISRQLAFLVVERIWALMQYFQYML